MVKLWLGLVPLSFLQKLPRHLHMGNLSTSKSEMCMLTAPSLPLLATRPLSSFVHPTRPQSQELGRSFWISPGCSHWPLSGCEEVPLPLPQRNPSQALFLFRLCWLACSSLDHTYGVHTAVRSPTFPRYFICVFKSLQSLTACPSRHD